MFGQSSLGSNTSVDDSASRMFRVEVRGLRQTYRSNKLSYPIRRSGSTYVTVPYGRMSEEMQRINRLGGKIVSIEPLNADHPQAKAEATAAHQNIEATAEADNVTAAPVAKG
ncbi:MULTISPECIES: phycobilisome linker polypeptide [Trichocoleus]|uniref:Phycobilisome linker polypeptide n=1 Tax=Trichocoleus desertorum GB2-A4 TaxID=2933944 RepID=A0ABV0J6A6_9CYAN|nr:phycobilisome linker polypeptide [Trichocoleus sp. FACHB-46]MBD1863435.1 phycobilisome linker polypeptide [Trichocoleus sp. FACHB-46]MBD2123810.1 phycobilisome linker polypeptide [Trichocoleus sp. FACHB-262]